MSDNKRPPKDVRHGSSSKEKEMYDMCKSYKMYHVLIETKDGEQFDAIVMDVKKDQVELLVPEMMEPESYSRIGEPNERQPRYRRFGGLLLPLAGIAALSLIPYYRPYPYYGYPYPYPYY
ncbi:hypothetical protein [Pseudalkalibacillus berkeleyi]|uniref:Uncharacterized protein n=1 Tax=Pseudalkalibacillus berkeleyi TaxID=1069813 RepID=A0ABS9GXL8_9BACL|nr:hypothetical protein [Pseudalkalibacillus berkeleyi]MCF6136223.1 hypothetical protein [Pseudalkalibacillus berkeleyi]